MKLSKGLLWLLLNKIYDYIIGGRQADLSVANF